MITGFNWVIPGKLASGGLPGLLSSIEEDCLFLVKSKISFICTLTETPPNQEYVRQGFETIHFPISDMGIPQPAKTHELILLLLKEIDRGQAVFVHCRAGKGRTGTILAALLVAMGKTPTKAIKDLRVISRHYIETPSQENFVSHYSEYILGLEKND